MYKVYILKSLAKDRYYIGHTRDLEERLRRHNRGLVKSTKPYKPWKLVYSEDKEDKSKAFKRELQIKSYKGGNAFNNSFTIK
jgi:putative endonuclease